MTTTPSNPAFQLHKSFKPLVSQYDGFILDQFGVMHNGQSSLEGASECVSYLHSLGKKLIILSNTSSTKQMALQKLPKLGFDPKDFVGAVTSGEEASQYIRDRYGRSQKKIKVLWITWKSETQPSPRQFWNLCCENDDGDDSNLELVNSENAKEADLILAHGSGVIQGPSTESPIGDFATTGNLPSSLKSILESCAEKQIPMICANPDFIMVKPDGSIGHMPGKIAHYYEHTLGGSCEYFGKPHLQHFQACLRDLNLPFDKVAHVGDSLHHDIKGAIGAGIDSVFVSGGVHRQSLKADLGVLPEVEDLARVFEEEGGYTPTHVVPMFRL